MVITGDSAKGLENSKLNNQSRIGGSEGQLQWKGKKTWQHPEMGDVKLNVSSVYERNGQGVRLGIIARNYIRNMLQTWTDAREGIEGGIFGSSTK